MKAVYDPLKPHKQFVLPEDFEGFHPERIKQIREIRKGQKVQADMCLVRDSEQLKSILRYRLKKMGFMTKYGRGDKKRQGHLAYARLARRTGIDDTFLSAYFNHNRYIWNEANGKYMNYISQTNLIILCLFAGIELSLDIYFEPLEFIE